MTNSPAGTVTGSGSRSNSPIQKDQKNSNKVNVHVAKKDLLDLTSRPNSGTSTPSEHHFDARGNGGDKDALEVEGLMASLSGIQNSDGNHSPPLSPLINQQTHQTPEQRIDHLQAELNDTRQQNRDLSRENDTLKQNNLELNSNVENLEIQVFSLRNSIDNKINSAVSEAMSHANKKIEELTQKINQNQSYPQQAPKPKQPQVHNQQYQAPPAAGHYASPYQPPVSTYPQYSYGGQSFSPYPQPYLDSNTLHGGIYKEAANIYANTVNLLHPYSGGILSSIFKGMGQLFFPEQQTTTTIYTAYPVPYYPVIYTPYPPQQMQQNNNQAGQQQYYYPQPPAHQMHQHLPNNHYNRQPNVPYQPAQQMPQQQYSQPPSNNQYGRQPHVPQQPAQQQKHMPQNHLGGNARANQASHNVANSMDDELKELIDAIKKEENIGTNQNLIEKLTSKFNEIYLENSSKPEFDKAMQNIYKLDQEARQLNEEQYTQKLDGIISTTFQLGNTTPVTGKHLNAYRFLLLILQSTEEEDKPDVVDEMQHGVSAPITPHNQQNNNLDIDNLLSNQLVKMMRAIKKDENMIINLKLFADKNSEHISDAMMVDMDKRGMNEHEYNKNLDQIIRKTFKLDDNIAVGYDYRQAYNGLLVSALIGKSII